MIVLVLRFSETSGLLKEDEEEKEKEEEEDDDGVGLVVDHTSSPEASAPCYLTPTLATSLWWLPPRGTAAPRKWARKEASQSQWQRRYIVLAANFVYIWASVDDVTPPFASAPLCAICIEDHGFEARPESDDDVAPGCPSPELTFAFELVPPARGTRGHRFRAESARILALWAASLKRSNSASTIG